MGFIKDVITVLYAQYFLIYDMTQNYGTDLIEGLELVLGNGEAVGEVAEGQGGVLTRPPPSIMRQ